MASGAEGIAGVAGGGDQHALADVAGQAEQRGDLGLVVQVQRGRRADDAADGLAGVGSGAVTSIRWMP
jgi:hypothetical protein